MEKHVLPQKIDEHWPQLVDFPRFSMSKSMLSFAQEPSIDGTLESTTVVSTFSTQVGGGGGPRGQRSNGEAELVENVSGKLFILILLTRAIKAIWIPARRSKKFGDLVKETFKIAKAFEKIDSIFFANAFISHPG